MGAAVVSFTSAHPADRNPALDRAVGIGIIEGKTTR